MSNPRRCTPVPVHAIKLLLPLLNLLLPTHYSFEFTPSSFFCSCLFPSAVTLQKNLKLRSIKSYTHPSPAITSPHVLPALVHPWVQLPPPSSLVHPWFASPWLSIFHRSFTCFPLTIFFSCSSFWFPYSFNHCTNSLFTLYLTTISLITWPGVILFPVFFFIDPTQLQLPFARLLTPLSILSVLPDPFCSSLPFSLSCPASHPWFSSAVHSHVPAVDWHFQFSWVCFPTCTDKFQLDNLLEFAPLSIPGVALDLAPSNWLIEYFVEEEK